MTPNIPQEHINNSSCNTDITAPSATWWTVCLPRGGTLPFEELTGAEKGGVGIVNHYRYFALLKDKSILFC